MTHTLTQSYPHLAELLDGGRELNVNSSFHFGRITVLSNGPNIICQFPSSDMSAGEIFERLENCATRYLDEGVVTDDVNYY
jgi:hypothetical protein